VKTLLDRVSAIEKSKGNLVGSPKGAQDTGDTQVPLLLPACPKAK